MKKSKEEIRKKLEDYALEKGILNLEEFLQRRYEAELGQGSIDKAKEIEANALRQGVKLDFKKGLQKGYEAQLKEGGIFEKKGWPGDHYLPDGAEDIEAYALEKGIEPEVKTSIFQEGYNTTAKEPYYDVSMKRVENYASKKGIKLDFAKAMQGVYEYYLEAPWLDRAEEIKSYAAKRGVEVEFKHGVFQKGYDGRLKRCLKAADHLGSLKELEDYALKMKTKLELDTNIIQKVYKNHLKLGNADFAKRIEDWAYNKGAKINFKKILQRAYEEIKK